MIQYSYLLVLKVVGKFICGEVKLRSFVELNNKTKENLIIFFIARGLLEDKLEFSFWSKIKTQKRGSEEVESCSTPLRFKMHGLHHFVLFLIL